MSERSLVLKVLNGETHERKPWFADLSYLYSAMQARGELEDKYTGDEGYLQFHKDMGAGICFYAPFLWKEEYINDVKFNQYINNGYMISTYDTPKGSIKSVQTYSPETFSWAYKEHYIKTVNDLEIMLYIYENRKFSTNYTEFEKIDMLWGDYGIAVAIAPISVAPLQTLLARWAGIEKTVELFMDHPIMFDKTIIELQKADDKIFEIIAKSPARLIEFAENLSGDITGRTLFEMYNMPYYKKRISQLHEAGKYVSIHIDGTLSSCLPLLGECGFDVAEAVTPAPIGDIEVERLREYAGKDIIIWGGIPGALFSERYDNNMFENHVKNVLNIFKDDCGFVLGVADQVPPDAVISRVKRVCELVNTI